MPIQGTHLGTPTNISATDDGELVVRAIIEEEIEHASGTGKAYIWHSANTDIDAGDTILFVKNTGSEFMVLDRMFIHPANVSCRYSINYGSATTTPAGTLITGNGMNSSISTPADSLAYHDETAVADGTEIAAYTCGTTESCEVPMHGFILGKNQYIQINQETESTSGQISLFGHFSSEIG